MNLEPSLHQALKGGIAPLQEHLLQGSIVDTSKDYLINRLRGLCDNADSPPETFLDHEMVFHMKGNQQQQPVTVHLRHSLMETECWHLRYVGNAEMGDKSRHALCRSCVDMGVSESIVKYLNEIGFKMDFEFVAKGYFFHKGRMKVTVSKLFKMNQPGDVNNLEPITLSCLVELSVVAPTGQEQIGEDMKNFAEQLKPLVQLEKVDHRKLQTGT
ncbi:mediator of RNA polymerase II transcription subunit 18-like [Ruditapes philippinarum]|uniref:mediator of RNA polymerase II transcription subunit 18-like n=1 Tax=Ruditapes philippinarum TaxID=129788 RepID=UPI00295BE34B|nr:mediator of RNA polymerase II transcription subunit 18-like [Ruditapes philippinarum]XP_060573910.1 mediator of RNA polymerase II transcription subunit 18-like [Ruditapes philippinarum]